MAEILQYRIQFIANNPYGTYVSGDILELYYDDTTIPPTFPEFNTNGIVVYLNDVKVFSGPDIPMYAGEVYTAQAFPQLICYGTSSVSISATGNTTFPYGYVSALPDFPSCAFNGPVCDLIFVGTPTITAATGADQSDGAVTVSASSSNSPIEYRLGSNFAYGDGTGQSSGTFTGLAPGQYRIYARDSVNCAANILFTIGYFDDYGAKYRLEYDDPVGGVTKVDLVEHGYAGSVTEVKGADIGFERSLKGEASMDKFESILATKATVHLTSETDFAFSGIYTNDPEKYRMHYYKDGVLKGVYKVLPQQYSEEYKAPPYYVSVVAADGLASLKDYVFLQDDGQRFHESMKAIKLIAYILKKTKLELSIRVAINLYATGMNTAATDDPLDQAYVDCDTYYINETEPTLDYVLRQILEPFGASIVQENAVWNIVRVEEKKGSYDYREFDSEGDYSSNSSYDPRLDVVPAGSSGFHFSDRDHHMTLCPGYGKIRVFYRLGLRENILENGDFRLTSVFDAANNQYLFALDTLGFQLVNTAGTLSSNWESVNQTRQVGGIFGPNFTNDDTTSVAWRIEPSVGGSGHILSDTYSLKMGVANSLKISVRFKVPVLPAGGTVSIRVQYGTFYLLDDATWTTTPSSIAIEVTVINSYQEYDITAGPPDSGARNGYDFTVTLYITSTISVDYIKAAYLTNGAASADTILREINAEPRNTSVLEKEVTHGSYQSLITTIPQWSFGGITLTGNTGATMSLVTTNILAADILYAGYFRDSSGDGFETWTRDGISESSSLHAILLQQYAAQYKKSWRRLTGSFYSQTHYFNFLNVLRIQSDGNRLYLPISPTIDDKNNRVRGEFLELIDVTSGAGSDGSGTAPFSSGFTTGFGSGYR